MKPVCSLKFFKNQNKKFLDSEDFQNPRTKGSSNTSPTQLKSHHTLQLQADQP